jgi:hypothetical protein
MNHLNGYDNGFGLGSRLIGSDSRLTGRIKLLEMGVHSLGWPGHSAMRWAIRGPCVRGGRLGRDQDSAQYALRK